MAMVRFLSDRKTQAYWSKVAGIKIRGIVGKGITILVLSEQACKIIMYIYLSGSTHQSLVSVLAQAQEYGQKEPAPG